MSEIDDVRKAALKEAEKALFIQVEIKPETVMIKEAVYTTAQFFSRSPENFLLLVPAYPAEPVVELIGKPGPGEEQITYLQKTGTGVYECKLRPTVPGTHAYKVKESKGTDIGELVEVEVVDEQSHGFLREFFGKLISGKL